MLWVLRRSTRSCVCVCVCENPEARWNREGLCHPRAHLWLLGRSCQCTKQTNYLVACAVNQIGHVQFYFFIFPQSISNWSLYVVILCCSWKQGFHENHGKGEQKEKASWEILIVNIFPRCCICRFSGWENYSFLGPLPDFPLAGSDSFTTLNTWGQVSFS